MHDYQYVPKRQASPIREEIENLIHLVQREVKNKFTFSYQFIGSASRNMITEDKKSNTGFDFDVNIRVNDDDNKYTAKQIKTTLMNAFNKHNHLFQYDNCEDSKRVITIKVKDGVDELFHGKYLVLSFLFFVLDLVLIVTSADVEGLCVIGRSCRGLGLGLFVSVLDGFEQFGAGIRVRGMDDIDVLGFAG